MRKTKRAGEQRKKGWRGALWASSVLAVCIGVHAAHAQQPGEAGSQDRAPVVTGSDGGEGGKLDVGDAKVPTTAMSDAQVRERVEFLLSGYEYFPTRADLDGVAVAERMAPLLRDLSVDVSKSPVLNNRAVNALAYYQDADTIAHLRTLALTPASQVTSDRKRLRAARSRRYQAIVSYARAAGEQSLGDMEVLMAADDLQIRLSAISATGKHLGKKGKGVLETLLASETDPVVLRELNKHVR